MLAQMAVRSKALGTSHWVRLGFNIVSSCMAGRAGATGSLVFVSRDAPYADIFGGPGDGLSALWLSVCQAGLGWEQSMLILYYKSLWRRKSNELNLQLSV
jgi:hypothetical protein